MPSRFPVSTFMLVAAALVLGGCSSNDSSIRDAAYLDKLVETRGSYSDATLLRAGRDLCATAADGDGEAAFAELNDQVGLVNTMRVMSAAFTELCPDTVPDEMQGNLKELDTTLEDLDQSLRDFGAKYGG